MTLPKHMDKFREEKSFTEETYILGGKLIYLQKEVMDGLNSEDLRTLKKIAQKELKMNLMIDDELFMAILDRVCLLEKQIKEKN